MTLAELEGANMKHKYKGRDGESLVKMSKYHQPFGLHFHSFNKVDDHNNRRQSPISLERECSTKFWTDSNFAWYLSVTEAITSLGSMHSQNGGNIG